MLLAAAGIIVPGVLAQQPTFRSGTTLVEFTLVALDEDGNPITDLKKEDVVLSDGGRRREMAFFRFDGEASAVSGSRPEPPPGFVTNRPVPERNAAAILLDLINTGVIDQTCVRGQVLRYLRTVPPNTYAGLFRISELVPVITVEPFTNRVDRLRDKVTHLDLALRLETSTPGSGGSFGGASVGTSELRSSAQAAEARALGGFNAGIHRSRTDNTLIGLEVMGNHLAGIPGRKSLVWITSGMPLGTSTDMLSKVTDVNFEPRIRAAAERLASQGIAVYPVYVAPDCKVGLADLGTDTLGESGFFHLLADLTGGDVVQSTNDYTEGLAAAARDQRGTYTIGFYADDVPDDQWRSLEVSVTRPGVRIRHQQGYLAVRRAQVQSWPEKSWNDLAYQKLDSTGITFNGRARASGGRVNLSLEVAAADLYFQDRSGETLADLEIGLVEMKKGEPTNVRVEPMDVTLDDPSKDHRSEMIPVETSWPLNRGTTGLRAIVRDRATGRYGTLELAVQ